MSVAMETGPSESPTGGKKQGPPTLPRRRSRLREEPRNKDEIRELQTAFTLFDKNGDGKICRWDLNSALEMLGHPANEDVVEKILKNAGNRNGEIHEDSFILWMERMGSTNKGEDMVLQNAFSILDRDGDGLLSMSDLKDGLALLGETFSDKMLDIMFREADKHGSGRITFEDFARVLKK